MVQDPTAVEQGPLPPVSSAGSTDLGEPVPQPAPAPDQSTVPNQQSVPPDPTAPSTPGDLTAAPPIPGPIASSTPTGTATAPPPAGTVTDQSEQATAAATDPSVSPATGTPTTAPPAPAPAQNTDPPQPTTAPTPAVGAAPPVQQAVPTAAQPALDAGQAQNLPAQVQALAGAPNIDVGALLDQLRALGVNVTVGTDQGTSATQQMQEERAANSPKCGNCESVQMSLHMGDATTPNFDGTVYFRCLDCGATRKATPAEMGSGE